MRPKEERQRTRVMRDLRGRLRRMLQPRLLPIVIVGLCIAVMMKSVGLIEAAFAQQPAAAPASSAAVPSQTTPPANPYRPIANWTDRPPPPPLCKPDPFREAGETKILLDLKHRAAVLDARAASLARERQELDATRSALKAQLAALQPLADRLEAIKAQHQAKDDARWASLVATYGAMDPRDAARIFDGLKPGIVFNVLQRMSDRKSAAILAAMSPANAQIITERLAGEADPTSGLHPVPHVRPANALLPDGAP